MTSGIPREVSGEVGNVRLAGEGEEVAVARLLGEFRDWWDKSDPPDAEMEASVRRILESGDGEFLLAVDERGEAVGVCQIRFRWSVWTSAPDCWLEDLFVRESARRGSFGRRLVEAAMARARERGCRRIELDVNEQNAAALALYEGCGFRVEPKPPGRTLFVGRPL
jgi:GNAT superfamily N-acetyltransferase